MEIIPSKPLQRVLITGGAGFLASHLYSSFKTQGLPVRLLDIEARPEWAQDPQIEFIQGDIRNSAAVGRALNDVDAVVHTAFAPPRMGRAVMESVNVNGTRDLCRQAQANGVRRLVLISSTIVQRSDRLHPLFQGKNVTAMATYRASRVEAERIVLAQGSSGLQTAVVRPKTFVGPGSVSAFTIIFAWIRLGKPVLLLGDASARYQLLEIRDMAEGIRLLTASNTRGVFFFGAHEFGSLKEDLGQLITDVGSAAQLKFVPRFIARAGLLGMEFSGMMPPSELHYMSAWDKDSIVDTSRAVEELGWRPLWSNRQALKNSYDWYVQSMAALGTAKTIHPLPESHRKIRAVIETFLR